MAVYLVPIKPSSMVYFHEVYLELYLFENVVNDLAEVVQAYFVLRFPMK